MGPSVVSVAEPGRARISALLRDAVAVVCAASAGVHAALVPEHLRDGTLIGAAFALSALLLATAALRVRTCPTTASWAAVVLLAVGGSYLLSRTIGIPLLIPDPEPVDPVGTLTSLAEVAAAVAVIDLTRIRKESR
jgi:hypothetical protein